MRLGCGNPPTDLLPSELKMGFGGATAMIRIHLEPGIEAQLAAEAQAKGVALDLYLAKIVSARPVERVRPRTVAEAIKSIRELRRGNALGDLDIKDLIH